MSEEKAIGAAPEPGTVLEGRYRLTERLDSGGVGWVYGAKHLRLGTDVAIKMLKAPYARHDLLQPRFEREAKALAALRHPHIVSLTDYSISQDGHPYLVMERLEGRVLSDLIAEGPVEEGRARHILVQMLDALIYAHSRGFAHRDMKPGNVFLVELPTDPDHVKILDFGFVKLLTVDGGKAKKSLTRSGIAFGTPSYMCPEQATGGATDPRADLYSSTVVFFEMLAGRRPFVGEIPDVIRAHLTEPVPPLDVGGANIAASPELERFLERGMAKEPDDRFQSAEEMKEALLALPEPAVLVKGLVDGSDPTVQASMADTASRDAIEEHSLEPRRPPSRLPIALGVAAALTILALGAYAALGGFSGSDDDAQGPQVTPLPDAPVTDEIANEPASPDVTEADTPEEGATEGDATDGEATEGETTEAETTEAEATEAEATEGDATEADTAEEDTAEGSPDDPWRTREPDRVLDLARRIVTSGRPLTASQEERMRDYVREHRDDPRAHLVLAQHYVARGHTLTAVRRYAIAYRLDPAARHDPRMLPDLARLAAAAGASAEATRLLDEAYGADALGEIDRLLADGELDRRSTARLRAARERISAGGE